MSHAHTPHQRRTPRNHPMAWAIALALSAAPVLSVQAQQAFSPAWFAERGAAQATAAQSGRMPNGAPIQYQLPLQQQAAAQQKLKQSIDNLGTAAQAIALQQRLQEQARQRTRAGDGFVVVDGLGKGGLMVDENALTKGWINAREAVQSKGSDGRVQVSIEQTADKAILNWETFNIGANTTLNFLQNADWAVLNRVNDPNARPSQLLGQLKANGSVFVSNRNGVVFGNNSQVNVRNLVAAAARISDTQFRDKGLYSSDANTAALTDALGKVLVEQGARITTHEPATATRGGGYVLLAGSSVENAGQIETRKGQAQLAAGDNFVIRRGMGTAENTSSTTRGNEIAPRFVAGSTAGSVRNTGLIRAREGDITLAGREVEQAGVAVATTTLNQRGTVHLLNSLSDGQGSVTLAKGATTAVLIEDDGKATAVDGQLAALIKESTEQDRIRANTAAGTFDNLSRLQDRRDQSRVEIVSGGSIDAQAGSLTVATGGQITMDARQRTLLADGSRVDVSGATGVRVSMESNELEINIQGNELRDSPQNRDGGKLNNNKVWVDRRQLTYVPAGTGGYAGERWYAAGGLLEVGGYLGLLGRSMSEWASVGGTVQLAGNEVVSSSGSHINLAGGSLDVASGVVRSSWLRGDDGMLYRLEDAPTNTRFVGFYRGHEVEQQRWGVTDAFRNPVIASEARYENGYTVGRDAGRLLVSAPTAILQGQVDTSTFTGSAQVRKAASGTGGVSQAQNAIARGAQLWVGRYDGIGRNDAFLSQLRIAELEQDERSWSLQTALDEMRGNTVWLDSKRLSEQQWGRIDLATRGTIELDDDLSLVDGGELVLAGNRIDLDGRVRIAGGSIAASNLLKNRADQVVALQPQDRGVINVGANARIDLDGRWSNQLLDGASTAGRAWMDGGSLQLESSHDVNVMQGARISVNASGYVDAGGKTTGGKGGNISLLANSAQVSTDGSGRLQMKGGLSGLGVTGGGRLRLATGGSVVIGAADDTDPDMLLLDPSLMRTGFSQYDINGHEGMRVAEGTTVDVSSPGLRFGEGAAQAASASDALSLWDAPLYMVNPATGRVSQRTGASLTLRSERNYAGGDISIGQGAQITVDPGQSISLLGAGDISVDGTLRAKAGRIALDDVRTPQMNYRPDASAAQYRIGKGALLDVSGQSHVQVDPAGRRQGLLSDGGSIEIGGALDWENKDQIANRPPDAFLVIERGAILDASGTAAELYIEGQGNRKVASNGGTIVLRSANGLVLDGLMRAKAGGDGAQGARWAWPLEVPSTTRPR